MSGFGARFVNIAEPFPGASGRVDGRDGADVTSRVQSALVGALAATPGTGPVGTLYFPPGRWIVGARGLEIPRFVTLFFSPGAQLVPKPVEGADAPPSLTIRGAIEAGRHAIFATPSSVFVERLLDTLGIDPDLGDPLPAVQGLGNPSDLGWIAFFSDAIQALDPAWWGAGSLAHITATTPFRALVDTDALRSAVISATRRQRSTTSPTPPLPVVLQGELLLHETLRADAGGPHPWQVTEGFTLRARGGRNATLRYVGPVGDAPAFEATSGNLLVEGLCFDGRDRPGTVLRLRVPASAASIMVRDCRFAGLGGALVEVREEGAKTETPGVVTFDGCTWTPSVMAERATVGLLVDAARPVVVRDSAFWGEAESMVVWARGSLTLDQATMLNLRSRGHGVTAKAPAAIAGSLALRAIDLVGRVLLSTESSQVDRMPGGNASGSVVMAGVSQREVQADPGPVGTSTIRWTLRPGETLRFHATRLEPSSRRAEEGSVAIDPRGGTVIDAVLNTPSPRGVWSTELGALLRVARLPEG